MAQKKKVTDDQVLEAYERTGSVWKAGKELGVCGQAVHERLKKLGKNNHVNVFTEEDKNILMDRYVAYRDAGKLDDLAKSMGRTKQFICRQAKELGLTDKNAKRAYASTWKYADSETLVLILRDIVASGKTITEYCESKGYSSVVLWKAFLEKTPAEYEAVAELTKCGSKMYVKGRNFEYAVKNKLQDKGYVVMRSPGSRSPADLVAVKDGKPFFIQCKLHAAFPVAEWNEFLDYAESAGAIPIMASRGKEGKGFEFNLLTGRKDGSKRRQPMEKIEM